MARNKARSDWARRYPPLTGGVLALVLAAAVLPSSLNVPQTNPQQTLEFAPVPPADEDAPPPPGGGDLGSLALGTSAGPAAEGTGGDEGAGGPGGPGASDEPPGAPGAPPPPPPGAPGAPPPPPPGEGTKPSTKQCVGNPPRQTEDPLAPPCVAFFDGDNGGATYRGVTEEEISLLWVWDAGSNPGYGPTSRGFEETPPPGTYVDLMKPPDGEEMIYVRALRAWQRYFNERYQTYGRRVHFWVYFADGNGTPEARKAEALTNFKDRQPFAVIPRMGYSVPPYSEALAQKDVMNMGGFRLRHAASFRTHPGLSWAFAPTVEQRARTVASYACRKMRNEKVSYSGNPGENGKDRKFGLVYLDEEVQPEYTVYGREVEKRLKSECGITIGENKVEVLWRDSEAPRVAGDVAALKERGVTTLINAAGNYSGFLMKTATAQSYFPEWLFAGDTRVDGNGIAQQLDERQMAHAWLVTAEPLSGEGGSPRACLEALRSVDSSVTGLDLQWYCALYHDARQFFTGVQVAGPRLTPQSMEEGFRAIPARRSSTPEVPACYYEPNDYTCVKDAMAEWWDPEGGNADSITPGCWRAVLDAQRFRAGEWPRGDPMKDKDARRDPCNTFRFTV